MCLWLTIKDLHGRNSLRLRVSRIEFGTLSCEKNTLRNSSVVKLPATSLSQPPQTGKCSGQSLLILGYNSGGVCRPAIFKILRICQSPQWVASEDFNQVFNRSKNISDKSTPHSFCSPIMFSLL